MVFVTEVPMLAPMMGWRCELTGHQLPPTTMLVLEEDCTKTVAKMPTPRIFKPIGYQLRIAHVRAHERC